MENHILRCSYVNSVIYFIRLKKVGCVCLGLQAAFGMISARAADELRLKVSVNDDRFASSVTYTTAQQGADLFSDEQGVDDRLSWTITGFRDRASGLRTFNVGVVDVYKGVMSHHLTAASLPGGISLQSTTGASRISSCSTFGMTMCSYYDTISISLSMSQMLKARQSVLEIEIVSANNPVLTIDAQLVGALIDRMDQDAPAMPTQTAKPTTKHHRVVRNPA